VVFITRGNLFGFGATSHTEPTLQPQQLQLQMLDWQQQWVMGAAN